jgi:hypothetical protein
LERGRKRKPFQEFVYNTKEKFKNKNNVIHQILFERGGEGGGGNGNIMEVANLFKVHCTHVWDYHNKPLYVISI